MEEERENNLQEETPLFEFSNLYNMNDINRADKGKKTHKLGVFLMLALVAVMIILFLYSGIVNILEFGLARIPVVLSGAFAVFVVCLILFLSALGKWNSFLAWSLKFKKTLRRDGRRTLAAFENEQAEIELKRNAGENALYVFDDKIVLKHLGEEHVYNFNRHKNFNIIRYENNFELEVEIVSGCFVTFNERIDNTRLCELLKVLPNKVNFINGIENKVTQRPNLFAVIFTAIPLIVGIILISLFVSGYREIPLIIGIIFGIGGLIAFLSVFANQKEVIKKVFIPFLFSIAFFVFCSAFLLSLFYGIGSKNFFHVFVYYPFSIALLIFILVGAFGMITSIYSGISMFARHIIFSKDYCLEKEKEEDFSEIGNLIYTAFKNLEISDHTEHELVKRIRGSKRYVNSLSLVARTKNRIIGHIMLSKLNDKNLLILAPLSVIPDMQGKGIGSDLLRTAHSRAKREGYNGIIVIGHEDYYPKFGYREAAEYNINLDLKDIPSKNIMALIFTENISEVSGKITLPKMYT